MPRTHSASFGELKLENEMRLALRLESVVLERYGMDCLFPQIFSTVISPGLGSGSERERERERNFYVIYGERQVVTEAESVGRCCDDNERPLNL